MIKINNLKIPLSYDMEILRDIVSKRLNIEKSMIENIKLVKRSVDTSDKEDIHFKAIAAVYAVGGDNSIKLRMSDKEVSRETETFYIIPEGKKLLNRPVVIGFGPAGMFSALILAQAGQKPLVLERGADADKRRDSVEKFWRTGILDTSTNVQFGEGGAGTFSDGKLKIGMKNPRKTKVLAEFVEAGAPEEIMYSGKPHIGTDKLNEVVRGIRQKIISLGGEIRFNTELTSIIHKNGHITGIGFIENEKYAEMAADNVILAIGHSARDTFEKLLLDGIFIEQKPFAVGIRIEHPQKLINEIQYHSFAGNPILGAADYRMVVHLPSGRGVYTFCMCPGGTVVAAASERDSLVTNGMSEFKRDGTNANSALLVTIDKNDLKDDSPLAGVDFQRRIEKAAFISGGGEYKAPVQRLQDFICCQKTVELGDVIPTYMPGYKFAEVDSYMPEYVACSLRQGIREMGEWMPGFNYPDAVLTGAETRSASPVKITRDEGFEAVGIKGLYPCGEGAGYAGGIVSAAVDGILCAEKMLQS